jgi:hypothetical protein
VSGFAAPPGLLKRYLVGVISNLLSLTTHKSQIPRYLDLDQVNPWVVNGLGHFGDGGLTPRPVMVVYNLASLYFYLNPAWVTVLLR